MLMKIFDFFPFDKADLAVGLLMAALSLLLTESFSLSIFFGCASFFMTSFFKDYFSLYRIKATFSSFFDSFKSKYLPIKDDYPRPYNAVPKNHPYLDITQNSVKNEKDSKKKKRFKK
jgi:hypothetical protein